MEVEAAAVQREQIARDALDGAAVGGAVGVLEQPVRALLRVEVAELEPCVGGVAHHVAERRVDHGSVGERASGALLALGAAAPQRARSLVGAAASCRFHSATP